MVSGTILVFVQQNLCRVIVIIIYYIYTHLFWAEVQQNGPHL